MSSKKSPLRLELEESLTLEKLKFVFEEGRGVFLHDWEGLIKSHPRKRGVVARYLATVVGSHVQMPVEVTGWTSAGEGRYQLHYKLI